ncbi:interferon alpha/beta receptor 2 isoform X2 [Chamaea fasciata]|uniref:interferon alpha/beta receptor 2 isoform X2 n=1 Tax=Chamaea fasciata TaxID=190680 RepID=UPI00336A7038
MDVPMPLPQLERILPGLPYKLQMESQNFQHVLSWQAERDPAVPASYNVLYRERRRQNWLSAQQCSGTAQLSCELTEEFKDSSTMYILLVQSMGGAQVLNSSVLYFEPFSQTYLGPPEVNVTSCPNCINVTIKLPATHFRKEGKLQSLIDIYEELNYDITLKSQDGEHKRPRQTTTEEVFSTVIEELYPSRNYCVSVAVSASLNKHFIPSPWKCVTADAEARQGYHEAAVAGAVCVSLVIVAVLKCAHAAGFILQKISLPQTLACIKKLAYSPWASESEEVASVEIIPTEVKSKARGCRGSASDDSDSSDSDGSDLCDHDYTRRGALRRSSVPQGWNGPSSLVQYSDKSSCEHSSSGRPGDSPAAEPRQLRGQPEGEGASSSGALSPFCEGSSDSQGSSECFTINLHTVLLGTLEQDGHGAAAAPPAREDEGDWHCAHALEEKLLEDTSVREAPCSNHFHEWQNSSSSSEESDPSDSDTELVTGYMRR